MEQGSLSAEFHLADSALAKVRRAAVLTEPEFEALRVAVTVWVSEYETDSERAPELLDQTGAAESRTGPESRADAVVALLVFAAVCAVFWAWGSCVEVGCAARAAELGAEALRYLGVR